MIGKAREKWYGIQFAISLIPNHLAFKTGLSAPIQETRAALRFEEVKLNPGESNSSPTAIKSSLRFVIAFGYDYCRFSAWY